MSKTNINVIIERVRKLMAMANDKGSPEEAAIAFRRARKLMDDNQLSIEDISERSKFSSEQTGASRRFIPEWEQQLAVSIANLNDCIVTKSASGMTKNGNEFKITFKGFEEDVKISEYMFVYLVLVCKNECSDYMKELGYTRYNAKVGTAFKRGFASQIRDRFRVAQKERRIEISRSTDLMVVKIKAVHKEFGDGNYKTSKSVVLDGDMQEAFDKGRERGKNTKIHDAIEPEEEKAKRLDNK